MHKTAQRGTRADSELTEKRVQETDRRIMHWRKASIWTAVAVTAALFAVAIVVRIYRWRPRTVTVQGAVIRNEADPRRRLPISGVIVTATDGMVTATTESDASGYFKLKIRENVWPGHMLQLMFRKPDYKDYDLSVPLTYRGSAKQLYIAQLSPLAPQSETPAGLKLSVVSNVRIRFTENTEGDENIGSAVKTFEVANKGNVPCNGQAPCSP